MYNGRRIGVVVPVYCEEKLILKVLSTMPDFVDTIIVVDDKSNDSTASVVEQHSATTQRKIVLIQHPKNEGVGAAIVTGYKRALEENLNFVAVMAGDAQMDPNDLPSLLEPLINGEADYSKGNRLFTGQAWQLIPKVRYLGNAFLSLFTKIASGYWHVADSQSGYTAITIDTLRKLKLDSIYKRYGMPNDMLVHLNVINARVVDVPVRPIYNIGEKTGIRLWKVVPTMSWLLLRRFFWRMKEKYIIRDFHPLIFFYGIAIFLTLVDVPLSVRAFVFWLRTGNIPPINMLTVVFITLMAVQFLLFAMWFDMEYNKTLR